jgi:hypothetical protein
MKIFSVIFLTIIVFGGCAIPVRPQSYKLFEENKNLTIGGSLIPEMNRDRREVYSEDKYIYRFEIPPKCVFGYLTNKNDNPEKVIDWVILSGKEYCKEQIHY